MAANGKTPLEPPAFESLRLRTKWFDKWYKLKIDGFIFFLWCTNWNTIRAAGNLERLDCNILSFKAIKRSCARPGNHTWSGMVSLQSFGRNLEFNLSSANFLNHNFVSTYIYTFTDICRQFTEVEGGDVEWFFNVLSVRIIIVQDNSQTYQEIVNLASWTLYQETEPNQTFHLGCIL